MSKSTSVAKRTKQPPPERIDPLRNISGIADEMEVHVSDAIAIVRTAQERLWDQEKHCEHLEEADCGEVLALVIFRLEQIEDDHALIVKNLQYHDSATSKE